MIRQTEEEEALKALDDEPAKPNFALAQQNQATTPNQNAQKQLFKQMD